MKTMSISLFIAALTFAGSSRISLAQNQAFQTATPSSGAVNTPGTAGTVPGLTGVGNVAATPFSTVTRSPIARTMTRGPAPRFNFRTPGRNFTTTQNIPNTILNPSSAFRGRPDLPEPLASRAFQTRRFQGFANFPRDFTTDDFRFSDPNFIPGEPRFFDPAFNRGFPETGGVLNTDTVRTPLQTDRVQTFIQRHRENPFLNPDRVQTRLDTGLGQTFSDRNLFRNQGIAPRRDFTTRDFVEPAFRESARGRINNVRSFSAEDQGLFQDFLE